MAKVGRPKGSIKEPTVSYHRRVNPKFIPILDKFLKELKTNYCDDAVYNKMLNEIQEDLKNFKIKVFTNKNI